MRAQNVFGLIAMVTLSEGLIIAEDVVKFNVSRLNKAGPCVTVPPGWPDAGYEACCPSGTSQVGDGSACFKPGYGNCALYGNGATVRCYMIGGSLDTPACTTIPEGYDFAGVNTCCPVGSQQYGDGSACIGNDDRCAIWGNPALDKCPLTATATGDPHITNMAGERFNVLRPGAYTLVEVPRGALPGQHKLLVTVQVNQLLGACQDNGLYVQEANFSGSFLQDHNLTNSISFQTVPEESDALDVLQAKNMTAEAFAKIQPGGTLHFLRTNPERQNVKFNLGQIAFDITGLRQNVTEKNVQVNYMDLNVAGLGSLKMEVGGLLGTDDYSSATMMPEECQKARLFQRNAELRRASPTLGSTLIASSN